MKRLILIILLTSFAISLLAQITQGEWLNHSFSLKENKEIKYLDKQLISHSDSFPAILKSYNYSRNPIMPLLIDQNESLNYVTVRNVRNIPVSRNPEQVILTKDDQFAYIRCFLSNTIEILKIPTGEIVDSLSIPSPQYISLSNDGTKLFIASFTDYMFPPDPPVDDCGLIEVPGSGKSFVTTVDIFTHEIINIDTITILFIRKILQPLNDSIIYLVGDDIVESNLFNSLISRRWIATQQIRNCEIDNKNQRIFLTTVSSSEIDSLNVIELKNGSILSVPYYTNSETDAADYIGIDTLSNRIFIQGKIQPYLEVIVFDAISLNQLNPIYNASLIEHCFLVCPSLGSIFIGGGFPYNTIELDYFTLNRKNELPSPHTKHWKTIIYNDVNNRLYSFQYGATENSLALINPPQNLDIMEYDIKTGETIKYETTEFKYGCSSLRTLVMTKNGNHLIATNSPDNSVSILDLFHESIEESIGANLFEIYPNPTTAIIQISLKNELDSDFNIEIYNIFGELLQHFTKTKSETYFTIDLTNFAKGQYYIHINSSNQSYFRKAIKI